MFYFLDFEASSLTTKAFPVEVAWVDEEGRGEHYLIRPHSTWLENGCPGWSIEAEAIHGIRLEDLAKIGTPVEQVAARAAEVFFAPGGVIFADQPDLDERWLDTLFEFGGVPGRIGIHAVVRLYSAACRPLIRLLPAPTAISLERSKERFSKLAIEVVERARELETLRPGTRHRALAEAETLWRTWRTIQELVAERLA